MAMMTTTTDRRNRHRTSIQAIDGILYLVCTNCNMISRKKGDIGKKCDKV